MIRVPRLVRSFLFTWVFLIISCFAEAAALPVGFQETQIATGLSRPTAMAFAPDGRLFVCEQGGAVRVIKNGSLLATPFHTLTVSSIGERGLLGIAFDPNFQTNRFVYLYYTATSPTIHNRLSRFTANGDVVVPGSEVILLDLETLVATNHNGGAIHFGTDGKLYVGTGENAVSSNAQSMTSLLGKILRINSNGTIPTDNPFFTTATGVYRSIWAIGLRNPFTFAVHPLDGTIFINDVGQVSWEEINQGVGGANYGWPTTEGYTTDPRFRSPLYAYDHSEGCAIAGGTFHNLVAPQFPFKYWGGYFFADLCGGWIQWRNRDGVVSDFASGISRAVDLHFGSDGALYYLARGTGTTTGVVRRISYTKDPPFIDVRANGGDGPVFLTAGQSLNVSLTFDAGPSGVVNSAEMYVALLTPSGVFWVDPTQGFVQTLARVHVGPLGTFGPSTLSNIPDVAGLAPGGYAWIVLIDADQDGALNGDFSDVVIAVVE
jgi:glucose/arabinose dehydrogenase